MNIALNFLARGSGLGDSPKPDHGYRIARLAQVLHEFLRRHRSAPA